ncbi:MAG: hypothetical protein IJS01_05075 [Lentisphaeria bacterium]|nr:hypothetical protein [Lentisphaeria bacterium]
MTTQKNETTGSASETRLADFRAALAGTALGDGQWELADYTTTGGDGVMLFCRGRRTPDPVTVRPNITGWHRIYVCLLCSGFPSPGIAIKLAGDLGPGFFRRSLPNPKYPVWNSAELSEEFFWQCADMTGQEITISKLLDDSPHMIGLLWFRFEPMTQAEIETHLAEKRRPRPGVRGLHAHTDLDWTSQVQKAPQDLFAPFVQSMADSDAELLSVEFYPLLINPKFLAEKAAQPQGAGRYKAFRELVADPAKPYSWLTERCHERGLRVYAALRHSLPVCPPPSDATAIAGLDFAENHPEFYCVDRDGEPFSVISYAFPEAQDYIIGECLKVLPFGFDGINLFFHRGVMTAFEQPVLDLCRKLYDVDARLLPLDDPRLVRVHSDLLTGFMRKLRRAMDDWAASCGRPRPDLAVVGGYTLEDNARYGVDIARWAEEGLLDTVIVGNMTVFENIDDFRDEKNPGLVDLDKYRELKYHATLSPVQRFFYNDLDRMRRAVPGYLELQKRSKLAVYFEIPWECTCPPETLPDYARQLYEAGAGNLSLWDAFHTRVMNRAEWNAVSRLGHKDDLKDMPADRDGYGRTCRMLSINGISLATYHPAWRG